MSRLEENLLVLKYFLVDLSSQMPALHLLHKIEQQLVCSELNVVL